MSDSTAFSSTIPGGHEPGPVYSLPGAAVAGRTVLPAGAAFAGSGGCGGGSPLQGSSTISAPTPSRKSRALRASRGNAQADASFHTLAPDEPRHAGVPPLWTLCDGAPRRAAAGVLATTCMVARARFSHCVLGATDSTVFRIITRWSHLWFVLRREGARHWPQVCAIVSGGVWSGGATVWTLCAGHVLLRPFRSTRQRYWRPSRREPGCASRRNC